MHMNAFGTLGLATAIAVASTVSAVAADIPYRRNVVLKVGQSVVLKGVRPKCNRTRAPRFNRLRRLPSSRLGLLLDGGTGTVKSNRCGKVMPARAIKFRATRRGRETLSIYGDTISITVR